MMKVCFVGSGSIGKRHINNLKTISEERGIIPEIHLLRSSKRKLEGLDGVKECFDISELDDKYDMVFVTNPTFLHLDTLKKMIDRSDYFFVEKPVFDCIDVDTGFISSDKKIYVACPLRHTGVIRNLMDFVKPEKVFSVRAVCSSYLPDWRPGVDYRKIYSAHSDEGGGVRIDLIHEWDYLTYLFGFPNEVACMSSKNSGLEIDSEDLAVYIARDSRRIIELHLDYFGRVPKREFEMYTDENVYVADIINNSITANGEIIYSAVEEPNDKYINEMKYFLDFCDGKKENINDIDTALHVIKLAMS